MREKTGQTATRRILAGIEMSAGHYARLPWSQASEAGVPRRREQGRKPSCKPVPFADGRGPPGADGDPVPPVNRCARPCRDPTNALAPSGSRRRSGRVAERKAHHRHLAARGHTSLTPTALAEYSVTRPSLTSIGVTPDPAVLDAKLRVEMRTEIKRLHDRLRTTVVYVTHDQIEPMTLGTRVAVMKNGVIQQLDDPQTATRNGYSLQPARDRGDKSGP